MIDKVEVSEHDEQVFKFDSFEFVLHKEVSYILSDSGYFIIDGLNSFKFVDDIIYIINEDQDKFIITEEDFQKIQDIYIKFV